MSRSTHSSLTLAGVQPGPSNYHCSVRLHLLQVAFLPVTSRGSAPLQPRMISSTCSLLDLLLLSIRVPANRQISANEALCDRSRSPCCCPRSPRRIGGRKVQREFEFVTDPLQMAFAPRAIRITGTRSLVVRLCGTANRLPTVSTVQGRQGRLRRRD